MRRAFEIVDHTADVGIIAYGADVEALFSNAALALFNVITEPEDVEEKLSMDLAASGEGREDLLVAWLNELIYLFDVKHVLFSRFDIERLTQTELKATCYGERFDPGKHEMKTGVKAATYHMLKLDKNDDGYRAQIIFDV